VKEVWNALFCVNKTCESETCHQFEVCALNYAPEEREKKIHPTDVIFCKFSEPRGLFMSTVELRNDLVHAREQRHKVWSWNGERQGDV
jgi:hypothetical protein